MIIKLSRATKAQINAAVAEKVAGWQDIQPQIQLNLPESFRPDLHCNLDGMPPGTDPNGPRSKVPDYLHDANAVIALLEKTFCTFWWVANHRSFTGRMLHKHDAGYDDFHTFGSIPLEDGAFCRAACIALLRANGVIVEE